jgi:exodeoxyribonuclease VII small subunit
MDVSYEELMHEIKTLIQKLENSETSLEETISVYERGISLIGECEKILESAEMKISELKKE